MTIAAISDRVRPAVVPKVSILSHAVAAHELATLRRESSTTSAFRDSASRLTTMVMLEATRDLPTSPCQVRTPLMVTDAAYLLNSVVIVKILRAADAMIQPILQFFPGAPIGTIGTRRNEDTAEPIPYYCKLPPRLEDKTILLVDQMLATGGSAVDAIDRIKAAGGVHIRLLCLIAAPEGVILVNRGHPNVRIFAAALDKRLNDRKYIEPGLGDAGDRWFGTVQG